MTKAYVMNSLVEKMLSPDQDFRYMGLNDLMAEIKQDPGSYLGDEAIENKVLKQVMKLVEDKISEVKNQAVKCLGQLIKILGEAQMAYVVDQLIMFLSGKDDELRDISGLALKTITSELPADGKTAAKACEKLTPRLLQQLASPDTPPETLIETLMTLSILITRFPGLLAAGDAQPPPLSVLAPLLGHGRTAVRKRAIATLAQFVPVTPAAPFSELLARDVLPVIVAPDAPSERQQTMVQLIAAVARHSAMRISPVLGEVVPGVLNAVKKEDEELRETCLQTLEALVLRCPTEVTPFLSSMIQAASLYIKYDPNYAGDDDDEDEEMADADDDDDAELDEYEDEEDMSYKIRRSATKLLSAVVATRPELLATLYKDVSPVLISRFGDREETVKLEVWATYGVLLAQTRVYGAFPQAKSGESVGAKRKRDNEGMELDDTPHALLRAQVPALAKALLNQMKSPRAHPGALQAGFDLLSALLQVLPGALSAQSALIASIAKSVLTPAPTTATSTLHLACLAFLRPFFGTHSPPTFAATLPTLAPPLLKALGERHPRIASAAFRACSALLAATRPVRQAEWAESVYDEALRRLQNHDTDAEVRACAEDAIADLWVCAPDVVRPKGGREWDAICRTSGRIDGAVKVITKVAREAEVDDDWVNNSVEWVMNLLKKGGRAGKPEAFVCLEALLQKYQKGIPSDLPATLVPQLKQFLSTADIALLSHALTVLSLLLALAPATTFPEIERDVLQDAYAVACSPLVAGAALDALLAFCGALVDADPQIATHVVPNLVIALDRAPAGQRAPANVAKCIAQVVKSQQGVAAGTIAEFSKHVKPSSKAKPSQVVLSLLVLGELGRFIDMSAQPEIFNFAINHFTAEEEEIRSAAAFATGNVAIGNLQRFLAPIIKVVQDDSTKRLLALHAVKEVVTHASHGQLELAADSLWTPLFENSETSEESARNVAAACLGKLTTTHPSRYLPQLHARIHDQNPAARATVVSAIRYTFADTATSYDELLSPLIVDFLSAMGDQDLTVRKLALSALNSAARTKAHLIRDHLPSILPNLYQETVIKPELIRKVQMGPWTQVFDDGLEARKTAYETMYTLLDTCLTRLDLHEFINKVMQGLADDSNEIKVISHMMLFRLAQVAPTAVAQRLDEATPLLEKTMKGAQVTKDTVKQDLERTAELQRSTLRATAALSKVGQDGAAPKFDKLIADLKRDPTWGMEFKELLGA